MDNTEFAITFFTALTVLANAAAVGLVGLRLAARFSGPEGTPARVWQRLRVDLAPATALGLAAGVAAVATAGSLYFSEVAGFIPCRLCWFQRGFMYPLVVILALAALATSRSVAGPAGRWLRRLAVAAALLGGSVSVWHLLIERYPDLESATSCDINNPCSLIWFERLGFITLPYMALSGFVLIAVLVTLAGTPARPAAGAHSASSPDRSRPAKHAMRSDRPRRKDSTSARPAPDLITPDQDLHPSPTHSPRPNVEPTLQHPDTESRNEQSHAR